MGSTCCQPNTPTDEALVITAGVQNKFPLATLLTNVASCEPLDEQMIPDMLPDMTRYPEPQERRPSISFDRRPSLVVEVVDIHREVRDSVEENLCAFDKDKAEQAEQVPRQRACLAAVDYTDYATLRSGSLWKLNHDVDPRDQAKIAALTSWRRRDYVLKWQQDTGKCGCVYVSEKYNGDTALFVILCNGEGSSPVEILAQDALSVTPLDTDARSEVLDKMLRYDTAMCESKFARTRSVSYYEHQIPEVLHPVLVRCLDHHEQPQERMLAFEMLPERQNWIDVATDPTKHGQDRGGSWGCAEWG